MIYYTGVGTRETPPNIYSLLTRIAKRLDTCYGLTLRSGGADGADSAFEDGSENSIIYLPTNKFNGRVADGIKYINPQTLPTYEQAIEIARQHHPVFDKLGSYAQWLHTRNVYQVLGCGLDKHSKFLVCYTEDGVEHGSKTTKATGGTGTAIRIATSYGVPVINVKNSDALSRIVEVLK